MNNGRDCPHGRQVGKCDTCDLIDAERRILELEAQVEQLSILCLAYEDKLPFPAMSKELFEPVFKARSLLAEIKAQAGRDGFISGYKKMWYEEYGTNAPDYSYIGSAELYADQLRQQGEQK